MKRTITLFGVAVLSVLLLWARVPDYPDFCDAKGLYYKFYRDDVSGHLLDGHDGEVVFWGLFDRDPQESFTKLKKLVVPAKVPSLLLTINSSSTTNVVASWDSSIQLLKTSTW